MEGDSRQRFRNQSEMVVSKKSTHQMIQQTRYDTEQTDAWTKTIVTRNDNCTNYAKIWQHRKKMPKLNRENNIIVSSMLNFSYYITFLWFNGQYWVWSLGVITLQYTMCLIFFSILVFLSISMTVFY